MRTTETRRHGDGKRNYRGDAETRSSVKDRPPKASPRSFLGRVLRWLGALVFISVLLIAALPYALSWRPLRELLLPLVFYNVNGTVAAEELALGWFSPVEVRQLEVRPVEGEPVVSIASITGDTPLWRIVARPLELGKFRIDEPSVRMTIGARGTNLRELFVPRDEQPDKADRAKNVGLIRRLRFEAEIAKASLSVRAEESPRQWTAANVNLALAVRQNSAAPGGWPELVVEPVRLLDRSEITPEMCNDFLKYIAPVVAGATRAEGTFSLELDRGRFPLDDARASELAGRLHIHTVQVGAGPLVQKLAGLLRLPASVEMAHDSVVSFTLEDRRVFHEGLKFGLPNLSIETHGSVGLDDQSLDIVAHMPIPANLLGNGPLLTALSNQSLDLPIRGTLAQPQIDPQALSRNGVQLLVGTLQELLGGEGLSGETLGERLLERGLLGEGQLGDGALLERLFSEGRLRERPRFGRRWRAARDREHPTSSADGQPSDGAATADPADDNPPTEQSEEDVPAADATGESASATSGDETAPADRPLRRLWRRLLTPPPE